MKQYLKCPRCRVSYETFGGMWRCFYFGHGPVLRARLPDHLQREGMSAKQRWMVVSCLVLLLFAGCRSGENQTVTGAGLTRSMPPLPPSFSRLEAPPPVMLHAPGFGTPPVTVPPRVPSSYRDVALAAPDNPGDFIYPFNVRLWQVAETTWQVTMFTNLPVGWYRLDKSEDSRGSWNRFGTSSNTLTLGSVSIYEPGQPTNTACRLHFEAVIP